MSATLAELEKLPALVQQLAARVAELEVRVKAPAPEPLVDAAEAGRLLGMSAEAVRAAAARGGIPVVRVGRRLRFRPADLATRSRVAGRG